MKHQFWIAMLTLTFALGGGREAFARSARHDRHARSAFHAATHRLARSRDRIVGNRRTHRYAVLGYRSRWPAVQDRVYFRTVADAQASGYHPAAPIPVPPSLTWQGTKRQLPSLGKRRVAPPPPKSIQQPLTPPAAQQPEVTPTNPMPN